MPTGIYIRTKEARENTGKAKMGNKNPMFGKPTWNKGKVGIYSKETLRKNREAHLGKHSANEFKKGHKTWNRGLKGVMKAWNKGIPNPNFQGENNPKWKGGITPLYDRIRKLPEYKEWRTSIYKRDNYTCQECGSQESGTLNAHHSDKFFAELLADFLREYDQFSPYEDIDTLVRLAIKWQPFWDAEGITYCDDCHIEEHKGKR